MANHRAKEATAPAAGGAVNGTDKDPADLSFWEYLGTLEDQWAAGNLKLYVYRVWPATDRKEPGGVYIAQLAEPIDEEYLLQTFGSGRYLLMVKDRRQLLRKHTVSVHSLDKPPKVDPSEVLQEPQNERYFKTWVKAAANPEKPPDQAGRSDVNQVLTTVLEKTGSFDPRLAELWEKTTKERDELARALAAKNAPPDLLAMVKSIKELFPTAPGAATAAPQVDVLSIITALKSMQPAPSDPLATLAQVQQILASQQQQNPAAADDFSRFEKFLSVADRLASFRSGAPSRNGWDIGLDFARELGPTVISPLLNIVNNAMLLRVQARGGPAAANAAGAAAPPMPTSFDPYKDAAAMRAYSQSQRQPEPPRPGAMPTAATAAPAAAPAANPTPIADTPAAAPQPDNQVTQLLAAYGGLLVSAINNGTSGADFADWLAQGFGTATHAMIAGHGEAALAQSMLAVPDLAIFGEARIRKFAFEFVHYDEILSEEEDEETRDEADGQAPPAAEEAEIEASRIYRPPQRAR